MKSLLIFFVTLFISGCIYASEESPIVFSDFKIESNGFSDSGPVVVSGKCGARGVDDMNIRAFGREVVLTREQLKDLADINVNGIQISLDGGYSGAGGRKIIIILMTGYYAGVVNRRYVAVAEEGGVEVRSKL